MRNKLWLAIFIVIIGEFGFAMGSYAQRDYKIAKIVKLRNGEAKDIKEVKEVDILTTAGKSIKLLPDSPVKLGQTIPLDHLVQCQSGVNIALQTDTNAQIWLNYNTTIQIAAEEVRLVKGEISTDKPQHTKFALSNRALKPKGTEFYLKASENGEPAIIYVFKGAIDIENGSDAPITLSKATPLATIDATQNIKSYKRDSDDVSKDIENHLFRARMWKKNIKRWTMPFWRKPNFYVPATTALATGAGALVTQIINPTDDNKTDEAQPPQLRVIVEY